MKRINISSGAKWEDIVSYSRLVRTGDELFVTGTVAVTPEGGLAGEDDAYLQACQCLRNIERALEQAGASLEDVVRTRLFVTDIARDWEAVGRAHAEFLGRVKPATTMVEVSRLIDPRYLVEIEAEARLGYREIAGPGETAALLESTDPQGMGGAKAQGAPAAGRAADSTGIRIEIAAFNDGPAIAALLSAAGLVVPEAEDRPVHILVARSEGKVLGCVGWEDCGEQALLRSCAVDAAQRNRGIGSLLVEALHRRLVDAGVKELYLLTLDAGDFFARFGFAPFARTEVPETVRASREFTIHACDRALCMRAATG